MPRDVKYHRTAQFRNLRDEWYDKLKESGFRDLEVRDKKTGEPNGLLLGMSPGDLARELWEPGTQRYYELARAHLHRVERRALRLRRLELPRAGRALQELTAWSLHAEGMPVSACAEHSGLTFYEAEGYIDRERAAMFRAESDEDLAESGDSDDE